MAMQACYLPAEILDAHAQAAAARGALLDVMGGCGHDNLLELLPAPTALAKRFGFRRLIADSHVLIERLLHQFGLAGLVFMQPLAEILEGHFS